MKTFTQLKLWLLPLVLVLAACAPAAPNTPTTPVIPTTPPAKTATAFPLPTQTPAPVATTTPPAGNIYTDSTTGFQLTYPAGWTLDPNKVIGSRASQALLLSPGTTAEKLADGGSRVAIVVYSWDPKNDLSAYLAKRKAAWDASGSKIIEESTLSLAGAHPAEGLIVQSTDGQKSFILITTAGEKYLEIVGEGDLAVAKEIALTLSPASQ